MKNVYIKTMLLSLVVSVSIHAGTSFIDELRLSGIQDEAFNALVTENQALKDGLNVAKEGLSAASKEFDILYAQSTVGALLKNTGESIKTVGTYVVDVAKTTGSNAVESMKSAVVSYVKNDNVRLAVLCACPFIGAGSGYYLSNKIFGHKHREYLFLSNEDEDNEVKKMLCVFTGAILGIFALMKF